MGLVYSEVKVVPIHAMRYLGGVDVYLHSFLIVTLDGGEWSAPGERAFCTQCEAGRALEPPWYVWGIKKSFLCWDSNTESSSPISDSVLTALSGILGLECLFAKTGPR